MKCYISYINVNIEAFLYIPVWICFSIPFKGRQAYPGEYHNPSSDPSIAKIVVVARWLLVCSSPAWLSICNHMFGIAVLRFLLLWLHPNEAADLSFQATFITDLVPANVISNNNYPGWSPPLAPICVELWQFTFLTGNLTHHCRLLPWFVCLLLTLNTDVSLLLC